MTPALDLTRYHRRYERGDLTVYLSWWFGDDTGAGPRPCLVLIPTFKQSWQRARPAVVLLEQAWKWSEEIGDPVYAARASFAFARSLELDLNNPSNVMRVRSIIVEHLGELALMPVMPADMRQTVVIGEAKVTDREAGRVVRHEQLVERV